MSSENTLTGRNGKFVVDTTLVARMTQWAVSETLASSNEWGDSDSAGFTNRSPGRKDGTFTAEGKFATDDEVFDLFKRGDIAIAVLWLDASSLYWDFPRAMCSEFGLTVNVDTEEVIGWTSSWGADGIFYHPGEDGATTRTIPA